ncbi:MAG: PIG-L family deacetylase, partial [Actinomycetota bacterium]
TSGEAGRIADPSLATREHLGRVREQEDLASWRALGLQPDVRFLRLPDGGLSEIAREDVTEQVGRVLDEKAPHVVVTFGPDGVTGHEDHIAIGAAASAAFVAAASAAFVAARAPEGARLLHIAIPASDLDRLNEMLRERGLEPMDPAQPFMPRGVSDEKIGVRVDCSGAYVRKLEALRCHRTQSELEDLPFDLWPEILGTESFVIAWPEPEPGAPVLADLFEGLPGS